MINLQKELSLLIFWLLYHIFSDFWSLKLELYGFLAIFIQIQLCVSFCVLEAKDEFSDGAWRILRWENDVFSVK